MKILQVWDNRILPQPWESTLWVLKGSPSLVYDMMYPQMSNNLSRFQNSTMNQYTYLIVGPSLIVH